MAITYPIQETDKFTVYDTNTSAPLKDGAGRPMTGVKWGSNDLTQIIPNLADNIKWLIEVKETQPSYDSLTQKIKRLPVNYDVANETATTQSFEVVDLTQEEIDAITEPEYNYSFEATGVIIKEESISTNEK